MPRFPILLVAIFVLLWRSAHAVDLPSGNIALYSGTPPIGFTAYGGTVSTVSTAGTPYASGWQLETVSKSVNSWDVGISAPIARAVNKGDRGLVVFSARTLTAPSDPNGLGRMTVVIQKSSGDYAKSLVQDLWLSKEWKEYAIPFEFLETYASGETSFGLELGFDKQVIQVAGLQLHYYGTSRTYDELPKTFIEYLGYEEGAPWRAAALARIEQIRKGNFELRLTDEAGNPVAGAKVKVEMTKHAFPFGSAVQFSRLLSSSVPDRTYQRKYLELFNAGGPENDLKWQPLAGDWGSDFTLARAKAGLTWMVNRGLQARGHVMVWPGQRNLPKAINDLVGTAREKEIPAMVLKHIDEVSELTQGLVKEWDVQNEPFDNKLLMDIFGRDIMVDWFKRAREKNPGVRLFLNDYSNHDIYALPNHVEVDEQVLNHLIAKGAPIDGFGIQAHLNSPTPPVRLLATFDHFADYGLPIHITEFDFDTRDEALQAAYTKDFLIACFSHPAVIGLQHWGFWEDAHWLPRGAMYRSDWSEKPNGAAFRSLVHGAWKTSLELTTDANGYVRGRGFLGDYRAAVVTGGETSVRQFKISSNIATASVSMTATPQRLLNLATRGPVGGEAGPLIVGLVIRGPSPKTMLIRGVGPKLTDYGLTNAAQSLSLVLYNEAGEEIATNKGWSTAPNAAAIKAAFAQAGAFVLPDGSGDCALLVTLPAGNYTAHVLSADATTGIALAEAYEVGASATKLMNLSSNGFVGSGENVLIGGLVVDGQNAQNYLIRASGPSLVNVGAPAGVSRPWIQLFQESKVIAENSGWGTAPNRDEIKAKAKELGAFPFIDDSLDSAMLVTLDPGHQYTVLVAGAGGTTGRAVFEIYRLP